MPTTLSFEELLCKYLRFTQTEVTDILTQNESEHVIDFIMRACRAINCKRMQLRSLFDPLFLHPNALSDQKDEKEKLRNYLHNIQSTILIHKRPGIAQPVQPTSASHNRAG